LTIKTVAPHVLLEHQTRAAGGLDRRVAIIIVVVGRVETARVLHGINNPPAQTPRPFNLSNDTLSPTNFNLLGIVDAAGVLREPA
jgi:hypothetical protein